MTKIEPELMALFNKYCKKPKGSSCPLCPIYLKCQLSDDFKCSCGKSEDPKCEYHIKEEIISVIKTMLNAKYVYYDEYYRPLLNVEKIVSLRRSGHRVNIGKGIATDGWNVGFM